MIYSHFFLIIPMIKNGEKMSINISQVIAAKTGPKVVISHYILLNIYKRI